MYVIVYNETEKQFEVIEGNVSNVVDQFWFVDTELLLAEEFACQLNNWSMKGSSEVKKCTQCGKFFILGRAEKGWFEYKRLQIPKRCHLCRTQNKKKKEVEMK